jgi:general secretion pathway protein G
MSRSRSRRRRSGFTLMEVLLVLAILVILGSLAAVSFTGVLGQSDVDSTRAQIGLIEPAVDQYFLTFRKYPTSLSDLVVAPADVDQEKWKRVISPMFGSGTLPRDAWEREFKFAAPGSKNPSRFDIWSSGPDGADGTDDDIGNWKTVK